MKFVANQTSQQLQQHRQYQAQTSSQSVSQTSSGAMNNINSNNTLSMNGPSGAGHSSQGMSSFAGASSSRHLSSDSGMSNGTLLAASTDASNDAAPSSGHYGAASSSSSALASHLGDPNSVVLTKKRLQDLVKEIDPMEVLDDEVEDVLLQIADEFIENVVTSGCEMAKHRKSSTLEVKDVQLHLQRNWNMWIPGFGSEELRPHKKAPVTDAHKQRLALIKKTLKKF